MNHRLPLPSAQSWGREAEVLETEGVDGFDHTVAARNPSDVRAEFGQQPGELGSSGGGMIK
jgi:hypothetical protein